MRDGEQDGVASWGARRLGEFATLVKGISYSSDQYCEPGEGAEFITIKCVAKAGGFRPSGIKYYKGPVRPEELLREGDLLIANTDLTRAGDIVGCPVAVPGLVGPQVTMSMDLSKLVINEEVVDPRFLYHRLMLGDARSFMREHSSGSTVLHLKTSMVPRLQVTLPASTVEQRCVARVLDTLDTTIRQTEAIIEKLKQVKQGMLHDVLTRGVDANGELRPPQSKAPHLYKDSPLGWMPREWTASSIDAACSDVIDCPHSTPGFRDDGVLVARTMHIKAGVFLERLASRVSEAEYRERIARLRPEPGDVVFTREAPVGEAFVIPTGMRICLGQRVMLLRPRPEVVLGQFLIAQIYSGAVADRIAALTAGTTNPHLNVAEVRQFVLPLPPLREQTLIQQQLGGLDHSIAVEGMERDKLLIVKAGLMDDLLTGRVRVTPLLA